MSLISWRKLQAGFSGKGDAKDIAGVVQHITNTTIIEAAETPNLTDLDSIADGTNYERVAAAELSSGIYKDATTSVKGIASFNANDFVVTSGAVAIVAASTTVSGQVELATTAETNTGASTTLAVTPDGLAESVYGEVPIGMLVESGTTALTIGDAKNGNFFRIPEKCNGWNIIRVAAQVWTAGTTGTTTVQLRNVTDSVDVLSTRITIDSGGKDSKDATTPAVINTDNDAVATGDQFTWDVDTVQTTAPYGLYCEMVLRLP